MQGTEERLQALPYSSLSTQPALKQTDLRRHISSIITQALETREGVGGPAWVFPEHQGLKNRRTQGESPESQLQVKGYLFLGRYGHLDVGGGLSPEGSCCCRQMPAASKRGREATVWGKQLCFWLVHPLPLSCVASRPTAFGDSVFGAVPAVLNPLRCPYGTATPSPWFSSMRPPSLPAAAKHQLYPPIM